MTSFSVHVPGLPDLPAFLPSLRSAHSFFFSRFRAPSRACSLHREGCGRRRSAWASGATRPHRAPVRRFFVLSSRFRLALFPSAVYLPVLLLPFSSSVLAVYPPFLHISSVLAYSSVRLTRLRPSPPLSPPSLFPGLFYLKNTPPPPPPRAPPRHLADRNLPPTQSIRELSEDRARIMQNYGPGH